MWSAERLITMNELPDERAEKHDADAALTRENTSWLARELSEEWQEVEPGIFHHVGPQRSDSHHTRQEANQASAVADVEVLKRKGRQRVTGKLGSKKGDGAPD
jgi:hypothetical protein